MPVNFETVEVTTDLLIIGGGMAACGAAIEAAYWGEKHGVKVTLVDKASMVRSGAVGMGLAAIKQYIGLDKGENTIEDFVKHVKHDLMGIARDDLTANIARHVDSSVHLFEQWGLPFWKDDDDEYVKQGKWQVMIHGESYKVIVAEAAKNALGMDNIYERIFITEPIMDGDRVAGAVGFSVRENKFYIFKAKAVMAAMGGAVGVFRPRFSGEGMGRSWYPNFSTGSSTYFTAKAGAELTCQEVRFIPIRMKDACGPIGAWFNTFKTRATNAYGGEYLVERKDELAKWGKYGQGEELPACLRNYLTLLDLNEGKGPIYVRTEEAYEAINKEYEDDPKGLKKHMKKLESEAWEDILDMTIAQSLLWAATDYNPAEKPAEMAPTEPYFISSYAGASGAWVSGPKDLADGTEYFWGYDNMTTVAGLFAAGDATGATSHKYSSGSHAEGRIAAKAAIRYILDNNNQPNVDDAKVEELKQSALKPLETFEEHKDFTTDPEVNPEYIMPRMFMMRLQKIMDDYVGGVNSNFATNAKELEHAKELLILLQEDSEKLAARDLNELLRAWEHIHRMWQAIAHTYSVAFREETRWPGYLIRNDFPALDEENWNCFVNVKYDPSNKEWSAFKRPVLDLFNLD